MRPRERNLLMMHPAYMVMLAGIWPGVGVVGWPGTPPVMSGEPGIGGAVGRVTIGVASLLQGTWRYL